MATNWFWNLIPMDYDPNNFVWEYGVTPLSTWHAPVIACVAYIVVVFGLQAFMKDRQPFTLRFFALIHNLILCVFSGTYVVLILCEMWAQWKEGGTELVWCDRELKNQQHGSYAFLIYTFYLSKFYELLDTVFLALKKKPIIFLHAYHHPATLVLCYVCLYLGVSLQGFDTLANATVHTFMYYYYFLAVLGKTVWWKKYITKMQIIQFVADLSLNNLYLYYTFAFPDSKACSGGITGYYAGQAILLSYLVLFVQFYQRTYKRAQPVAQKKRE
eukprot:TRINITY_DN212_c0_g4_i1.p1 TRINITY_DN212_c0_g4~~TRINITY_DN212_c0_g4_i1.p1  ORF type:complete len:318 (+),score=104.90 TRINITY_DN212_c0_g4_i1:140-955(+)